MDESIKSEIEQLVRDLNYHSHRYHVMDSPKISDMEYDALFRRLRELSLQYGYTPPDSPLLKVGAPASGRFDKVTHAIPMLSLDDVTTPIQVEEFDKRIKRLADIDREIQYTIEPKYDGLAVELTYSNGLLISASTRGDGVVGEDITENVKTIRTVPHEITGKGIPEMIDLRGEIYMETADFEMLNREREAAGLQTFANPRNAAAGSARQLDPSVTASRRLAIVFYGCGRIKGIEITTQFGLIEWLASHGFPTSLDVKTAYGLQGMMESIDSIGARRGDLAFEIDGAVIKVNDFILQQALGTKSRSPRYAIAYKFDAITALTRVTDVITGVGRTGVVTPVAILEPVRVGGVMVGRCTLHNYDEIRRKDIRIGDIAIIERAGDVIPALVEILTDKRSGDEIEINPPSECPECGSRLVRYDSEIAIRCISIDCPAQIKERIIHFAARAAMNIEGLGIKNVELLYEKGLIRDFSSIYRLSKADLLSLDRFADRSSDNLIDAIERSKTTTLSNFIFALGIRHTGRYASGLLAKRFSKVSELFNVPVETLMEIRQLGEKTASAISIFFSNTENIAAIETLLSFGFRISNPDFIQEDGAERPFLGKTFVITGTLPLGREEVRTYIEQNGGKVSSTVSIKTTYVVAGTSPGSKLTRAEELGVKVISYEELQELVKKGVQGEG